MHSDRISMKIQDFSTLLVLNSLSNTLYYKFWGLCPKWLQYYFVMKLRRRLYILCIRDGKTYQRANNVGVKKSYFR